MDALSPATSPSRRGPVAAVGRTVDHDAEVVFDMNEVSVLYGDFRAVRGATMKIRKNQITAFIGPSGCGKTTVLRCLNRMNDFISTAKVEGTINYHGVNLYDPAVNCHRGPPPHRHGVPEAQPVPEVDLRQRRLRPPSRR